MKSNKKLAFVPGLLLFVSIVLTFAISSKTDTPKNLSFDNALTTVKNKEVTEALISQDALEITTKSKEKFIAKLDASDASREAILQAANETGTTIKLEPASSGWGWLLLINMLPFIMMSAITLAAIIYVVKALTKNKG